MILTTEEVITTILKVISAMTKVILTTQEVITTSLKVISATEEVIRATLTGSSATTKGDLGQ